MDHQEEHANVNSISKDDIRSFDYSYVPTIARVAVYDDMKMPPHIIEIKPAPTDEFIEHLASTIDSQVKMMGGKIPYAAIREVSENFIHAQFTEVVVSIMDAGNTIRFCDQGPGIDNRDKAQLPGFTSAIEPMKRYIRGVGSGLPLVKEYLSFSHGTLTIEDNLNTGSVVTITLQQEPTKQPETAPSVPVPPLNLRERNALSIFAKEGALGVSELADITGLAASSSYTLMNKMEQSGLIEKSMNKKRILTDYGFAVYRQLENKES